MFSGALGDPGRILAAIQSGNAKDIAAALRPISETLVTATPYIFAGLGLAVSFQAGLFNLGVGGQFLIGGVGAMITATLVTGHLPPPLVLVLAILAGTFAGGAYGFIPGYLKARTGAHEVITTLMLDGVAPSLAVLVFGMVDLSRSRHRRSQPCRGSSTCRRSASTTASSSLSRWPRSCRSCCSARPAASSSEPPGSVRPPLAEPASRPAGP